MTTLNWNIFKAKFHQRENKVFESLAHSLFCYEHSIRMGTFRFKNQTGIETEPIEREGKKIGFQAKFYDTRISTNKADIIDSITKAKGKNPDLDTILIYTNQELSESRDKKKKKPKYQLEIEAAARRLGVAIEWRVPSNFEIQLSVPENKYLYSYFFETGNGIIEFLESLKAHTDHILFAIQSDIAFKSGQIKIDRTTVLAALNQSRSKIILLSGQGGSGKTAVIKDHYQSELRPFYVLKAAEFNRPDLSEIFGQFGSFGLNDLLQAHREETHKTFVIDSAEKLADLENQDIFIEFLSALIKDGWTIIFTTRDSYLEDLRFQLLEVYRLPFETIRLENLSHQELEDLSKTFSFDIPSDPRMVSLLYNLFYLNEYLTHYDLMSSAMEFGKFRDLLWQKKIMDSKFKKDNTHLSREDCFLAIARLRCETGSFFVKNPSWNARILSLLEKDEIIKYEPSQNGFFITHDIYEEWALEKLVDREYISLQSYVSFFTGIGNSLPVRRAFRSWLSNKIAEPGSSMNLFVDQVFSDETVLSFWKDELLISVLLSDYCSVFFQTFDKELLANNKSCLKKIIFLLRTACKEVDSAIQKILQAKQSTVSPAYLFTKPKGKGWEVVINFLHVHINEVTKEELDYILPLLKEWINQNPKGSATRESGLFALHFYKEGELKESVHYSSSTEKQLLQISLGSARELKTELTEITEQLLQGPNNRHQPFDEMRDTILSSNNESLPYIVSLPELTIRLAEQSWYQSQSQRHPFSGGIGVEQYYDISDHGHHEYHPASALQTPIYYLLMVAFPKTVKFILDFTNRAVEAYIKSDFDSSAHEIEVMIDEEKVKQYISSCLWCMYRGTGSPVTPYLLQSMHMALEKYLLEQAKITDSKVLEQWLIHLLKNSRSASITAVVTSIVLAYPDKCFNVAAILFATPSFLRHDNMRLGQEEHAKMLYGMGYGMNHKTKEFEDERMATCDDPHRKLSLENLALQYQFFKNEGITDEMVVERQNKIWVIIDALSASINPTEAQTEENKALRILLARIDRRKMSPAFTYEKEKDRTIVAFNPKLEPDLKEYSESGTRQYNETFKYTALKLWGTNHFEQRRQYGTYPQYDNNPKLVLKETRELIKELKDPARRPALYRDEIPAYTCAALIKKYSQKILKRDLKFCRDIVLDFATEPFREGYNYQIGDGVEVSVSAVPFLYDHFPKQRSDLNTLLLFLLFDEAWLGAYKRISDYAIETIHNNLFASRPQDANAILFGYLHFKERFEQAMDPREMRRTGKSRAQVMQEFVTTHESEMEKIEDTETYYNQIKFDELSLETLETTFQLMPETTENPLHLDIVKRLLSKFTKPLLAETSYTDKKDKVDHRLKNRFFRKYASFLLHRKPGTIQEWIQPFLDSFIPTESMAQFISDVVSEQDRLLKYEGFWELWKCFYPTIKKAAHTDRWRSMKTIIHNYLLAWPWWGEAKDWHSFKAKDTAFFKKVCSDMGAHPAVLYAVAKLLNEIGTPYLDEGVDWITGMLSANKKLPDEDIHPNTIYYLEVICRRYAYLNRTKLKTNRALKTRLLVLLDFLIARGSVNAYLLREDIF